MSLAREDALHRQILYRDKKIVTLKREVKIAAKEWKEKHDALFMIYIKLCERNADMQEEIIDLQNELLKK